MKNEFRAWDKHQGKYVETIFMENNGSLYSEYDLNIGDNDFYSTHDNIVVQHYSGRNDKENEKLFEGDIVEYESDDLNYHYIDTFVVEFHSGSFCLINNELELCILMYSSRQYSTKKIGNIFENPELIKNESIKIKSDICNL